MNDMKCWRVLYTPDDTAFMVWAKTEDQAFEKVKERNMNELDEGGGDSRTEYLIDEFTPETNKTGIMAFYDVYSVFKRKNEAGEIIECQHNFGINTNK